MKKRKKTNAKPIHTKKEYNFYLIVGACITAVLLLFVFVGIFYTPYEPDKMNAAFKLKGISWKHLMGCDQFGRDILSRVMKGSSVTLFVAFGTVFIGTLFGIIIGAVTGYFGGLLDEVLMRVIDALFAFPSILLALVFISVLGSGKYNVIIALGIAFIPSFARIIRSEFMRCRNEDYVKMARLAGASHIRIMFMHILPNILPVLISSIMIGFNNAVLAEASMSYLGIGVQPPDSSLGRMLSESQTYLFSAPWYGIAPGITIILLVLGFGLLGFGLKKS